jgi:hypothetical protein
MASESRKEEEIAEIHVEMWKHYDNLRQQKNSSFLTANAILAAIGSFSKDASVLIWALSAVGIIIAIAWFLLLTRNAGYIAYHRSRVGQDWTPTSWTPPSSMLDRALPVAFGAFWFALTIWSLCKGG